jgi:hypothetical protein
MSPWRTDSARTDGCDLNINRDLLDAMRKNKRPAI